MSSKFVNKIVSEQALIRNGLEKSIVGLRQEAKAGRERRKGRPRERWLNLASFFSDPPPKTLPQQLPSSLTFLPSPFIYPRSESLFVPASLRLYRSTTRASVPLPLFFSVGTLHFGTATATAAAPSVTQTDFLNQWLRRLFCIHIT